MPTSFHTKIHIQIPERLRATISRSRVRRIAQHTLRAEQAHGELSVVFVSNAKIRALNRTYHATDAPTDILTFPLDANYLGDIVISIDTARTNARAAQWSLADELDLLIVHGILHLCGYDDLNKRARAKMWKRQAEILARAIPDTK